MTTRFASPFEVSKTWAFGSPSTASSPFASSRSRESPTAQIPIAIAATAATAAADESTGSVNRRRSGTTFGRSLRACSRIRARSEAGGCGPLAARPSAAETCQNPCSSSRHALAGREVRLVLLLLVRVERVERVAGGQFV